MLKMLVFSLVTIALLTEVLAKDSGLCEDMAKFSCAPGRFDDGTGAVKSKDEVNSEMESFRSELRASMRERFRLELAKPDSEYFRSVSIAALGLQNSPQCQSDAAPDKVACQNYLLDGLADLGEKSVTGGRISSAADQILMTRQGNLSDLASVTQNQLFLDSVADVNKQSMEKMSQSAKLKNISDKVFPEIRGLIIAKINDAPISEDIKKMMIQKLRGIRFNGSECGSWGQGSLSGLLTTNAFYYANSNTFQFCGGLLMQTDSDFSIAGIMAHELAHSIDPCRITMGPEGFSLQYSSTEDRQSNLNQTPFSNVVKCLKSDKSVHALDIAPASGSPPICNDQVNEAFCDWMAAEVLPEYIEKNHKLNQAQYQTGYSNVFRLLCSSPGPTMAITGGAGYPQAPGSEAQAPQPQPHPEITDRINKIIIQNPKVRNQMGCKEKSKEAIYCDMNSSVGAVSDGSSAPANNSRGMRGAR